MFYVDVENVLIIILKLQPSEVACLLWLGVSSHYVFVKLQTLIWIDTKFSMGSPKTSLELRW